MGRARERRGRSRKAGQQIAVTNGRLPRICPTAIGEVILEDGQVLCRACLARQVMLWVPRPNVFDRASSEAFDGIRRHAQAALGRGTRLDIELMRNTCSLPMRFDQHGRPAAQPMTTRAQVRRPAPRSVMSSGAKRSRDIWRRMGRVVLSRPDFSARPSALVEMTRSCSHEILRSNPYGDSPLAGGREKR